MLKSIGFIFSNKCEVREGNIERKEEGKEERSSDRVSHKSADPDGVSFDPLGMGKPKKHRVHKVYICSQSGEKVQVPPVGQGVLH